MYLLEKIYNPLQIKATEELVLGLNFLERLNPEKAYSSSILVSKICQDLIFLKNRRTNCKTDFS